MIKELGKARQRQSDQPRAIPSSERSNGSKPSSGSNVCGPGDGGTQPKDARSPCANDNRMGQPKLYMFIEDGLVERSLTESQLTRRCLQDFNVRFDCTSKDLLVRMPDEDQVRRIDLDGLRPKEVEVLRVIVEYAHRVITIPFLDLLNICLQDKKELNKFVRHIRECLVTSGVEHELIVTVGNLVKAVSNTNSGYRAKRGLTWQLIRLAEPES